MIQLSTICRANSFRIIVIFLSYYFYNPYLPPTCRKTVRLSEVHYEGSPLCHDTGESSDVFSPPSCHNVEIRVCQSCHECFSKRCNFHTYMLQTICVALLPYCQWNKDYFQHFNMSFIIIYVIWNHITSKGLQWKLKKYLKCTKDRIKMMSRMM